MKGRQTMAENLPKVAPLPIRPKPQPQTIEPNHPAVAAHIEQFNVMARDLDDARSTIAGLRADLDVERRVNAELQHTIDEERGQKERFQRYAVALDAHVSNLHAIAGQALAESKQAALTTPPKLEPPAPIGADAMVAGIADLVADASKK
jgi:hypothetical protein